MSFTALSDFSETLTLLPLAVVNPMLVGGACLVGVVTSKHTPTRDAVVWAVMGGASSDKSSRTTERDFPETVTFFPLAVVNPK